MAKTATEERIKRLKAHLERENPALAEVVEQFQELDIVARKLGFMSEDDSYATQISWWPVVAVLGTFSAGKSTFLNEYLGHQLQRTGNQAVDDKFTVICYGSDEAPKQLPGLALDSDPRFPFYQISQSIESDATGEGKRIDSYLQLKTCNAEVLRGKILIDSPGFDADKQRDATLLITDHIIGLSDLVLVFFDARHPEPGAMTDTLEHLVANTINRQDSDKFLYILNQIDNTVREDNPEEVVAAWQRAMAQSGLTAGRFFRIYSEEAAVPIDDQQIKERMKAKRDEDLGDIKNRIQQLDVNRAYRVTGMLEQSAKHLRDVLVPELIKARRLWFKRSRWLNGIVFGAMIIAFAYWSLSTGSWDGVIFRPLADMAPLVQLVLVGAAAIALAMLYGHLRLMAGRSVLRKLKRESSPGVDGKRLTMAFERNLDSWSKHLSAGHPHNWSGRLQRRLDKLIASADTLVQKLNDRFTRPSGANDQ
ncbi:dynamin family protein [Pseudohongiella acticola]|jgi:GTPase SAR1 family protein|uniref:dynamin family protein n=1 Tax=Pseudohongiella acticola TaxID=1524254 RepID=UPI0030EB6C86